jgi:16S rRNA (guanine1207-N2)-methyltransferase
MTATEVVYGAPPVELAAASQDSIQVSPLVPGSAALEEIADGKVDRVVMLAPPGTLERRYALSHALRTLRPGGELIALAPKTKGGSRLAAELGRFGCSPREEARGHHRICRSERPAQTVGLDEAISAGAPRIVPALGLWSQPGVFSWDRLDPGTALLLDRAGSLAGRGADLGCGVGVLARRVLESDAVHSLICVDLDRRALEAARRNVQDARAGFRHLDVRLGDPALADLDFVVMNPPFHAGGAEDRGLGLAFISAAANMLRKGGICRLVANIALPYEGRLNAAFAHARMLAQAGGYKVYEAVK